MKSQIGTRVGSAIKIGIRTRIEPENEPAMVTWE